MTRRRSILGRGLLLALGVLLGLLSAEATLRGLRSLRVLHVEPTPPSRGPGPVVVCVGDSHTYGFQVQRELESYPAQLGRRLASLGVQVENLGWPGLNGAQIAGRLAQRLDAGRVDLVLALVGYNNSWNPAAAEEDSSWVLPRLWRILRSHSSGARADDFVILDGRPHWRQPDGTLKPITSADAEEDLRTGSALERSVANDLERILELCRSRQVPVLLQTYAAEQNERFLAPNAAARSVAAEQGAPLVDHAAWFRAHSVDPLEALQPDGHPTPLGYGHMVEAMLESLRQSPPGRTWNWDALDQRPPPLPRDDAFLSMGTPRLAADGTLEIPLQGTPGGTWMLGVSRTQESSAVGLDIATDETFERCRSLEGLHGRLDDEGRGMARLYPHLAPQLGAGPFYLQAVLLDPQAEPGSLIRAVGARVHRQEEWPR